MNLDIRANIHEAHEALKGMDKQLRGINKKILTSLTIKIKNRVTKNLYSHVEKQDGYMKKTIYKWSKSQSFGVVGLAHQGLAQTLEYGKHIVPKKKKYLTFKVGDAWVKTKEVNVPAHPFFFAEVDAYVSSPEFVNAIDAVVMKAFKRAGF